MEEEKPNMPKVPSRFIETKLVRNMKIGQIGFVMKSFSFCLDEDGHLWVDGSMRFDEFLPGKEFFETEDVDIDPQMIKFTAHDHIKIERVEGGFKAYLYELYEVRRKHILRCSSADACLKSIKKECTCKDVLRCAIFHPETKIHEEHRKSMLPVVTFDDPKESINAPDNLKGLTKESVKNYSLQELNALLVDATKDENYDAAILIRDELDKRK